MDKFQDISDDEKEYDLAYAVDAIRVKGNKEIGLELGITSEKYQINEIQDKVEKELKRRAELNAEKRIYRIVKKIAEQLKKFKSVHYCINEALDKLLEHIPDAPMSSKLSKIIGDRDYYRYAEAALSDNIDGTIIEAYGAYIICPDIKDCINLISPLPMGTCHQIIDAKEQQKVAFMLRTIDESIITDLTIAIYEYCKSCSEKDFVKVYPCDGSSSLIILDHIMGTFEQNRIMVLDMMMCISSKYAKAVSYISVPYADKYTRIPISGNTIPYNTPPDSFYTVPKFMFARVNNMMS
jgi:hypothetical protein